MYASPVDNLQDWLQELPFSSSSTKLLWTNEGFRVKVLNIYSKLGSTLVLQLCFCWLSIIFHNLPIGFYPSLCVWCVCDEIVITKLSNCNFQMLMLKEQHHKILLHVKHAVAFCTFSNWYALCLPPTIIIFFCKWTTSSQPLENRSKYRCCTFNC